MQAEPRTKSDGRGNSPVALIVAKLEGGPFYTISEASEITKIPKATLIYWRNHNLTKAPSQQVMVGLRKIYLYTKQDLAELIGARPAGQPTIRKNKRRAA